MARLCDVDIWHPNIGKTLSSDLPLHSFDSAEAVASNFLSRYDHIVYNLGNDHRFHGAIFDVHRRNPGIVILHDFVMYHFFGARYIEDIGDSASFVALFRRHYGPAAAECVLRSLDDLHPPISESGEVMDWPLFEEAIQLTYGIVVHSQFFAERVRPNATCPVAVLKLPRVMPAGIVLRSRHALGLREGKISVVIAGHLNANKRPEQTLRVVAASRMLRDRTTLTLVGGIDANYLPHLRAVVNELGLNKIVRFTGRVDDSTFYSYLETADVCVNLRFPNTEGASASVIEQMMFNNAVVVLDSGSFSELPNGAVVKISLQREAADLAEALERLIEDGEYRVDLANRAKAYAVATFREDTYASGMLTLFESVARMQPLMDLTDSVGQVLQDIGVPPRHPLVDRALEVMGSTFLAQDR